MAGSLTVLSAHRFGRAKEELQTAELLLKNANFRSSINRSYYAIFHAILAVNALDGFDSSKHSGVIAHFNQEYVKTGVFEKGASKIIRNASELREQADYEDFYEATQEEASDVFMQASQFISEVERYLHSKAILLSVVTFRLLFDYYRKKSQKPCPARLLRFSSKCQKFVQSQPSPCAAGLSGLTA